MQETWAQLSCSQSGWAVCAGGCVLLPRCLWTTKCKAILFSAVCDGRTTLPEGWSDLRKGWGDVGTVGPVVLWAEQGQGPCFQSLVWGL